MEPVISCRYIRASKEMEELKSLTRASVSFWNRPAHSFIVKNPFHRTAASRTGNDPAHARSSVVSCPQRRWGICRLGKQSRGVPHPAERLAEFRRPQPAEKDAIIFDRLCRPKNSSQPQVCPQGARSGCTPNFGRGQKPSRKLDTPVHYLLERSRSPGAPSKILFYGDPFKI